MAHWLVTLKDENGDKLYKCSWCGAVFKEKVLLNTFGPDLGKCPECSVSITGSAVDRKQEEMLKMGEQLHKMAEGFVKEERGKRIRNELLEDSGPGTYERYLIDITKYLGEKFPDEDSAKTLEAAGYISNRTQAVLQDLLIERDKMWDRHVQEMKKHYEWRSRKFRGDIREEEV